MATKVLFDDGCVARWALMHFAMIPVADATGRDISPSGLRGVSEVEHASVRHTKAVLNGTRVNTKAAFDISKLTRRDLTFDK